MKRLNKLKFIVIYMLKTPKIDIDDQTYIL